MIALWVFSVWILWVLTLITSTISTSDQISLKTTATMLAKENMEILYHKRNSNRIAYQIRDCLIDWNDSNACEKRLWDIAQNSWEIIIPTFDTQLWYTFYTKKIWDNFKTQRENTRFSFFTWVIWEKQTEIRWYKYCNSPVIPAKAGIQSKSSRNNNCWKKSFFWSFIEVHTLTNIPREDLLSWNIYKITSKTFYIKWWTTWEIVLESFIANLDKE